LAFNEFYGWDFVAAEREFRRALELNPKWPSGHVIYGLFLTAMNRTGEAVTELKRAQELDPLTPLMNAGIARPYYNACRYAEAIAQSRKTLELDSTFHRAHYWLGLSYEQLSARRMQFGNSRRPLHSRQVRCTRGRSVMPMPSRASERRRCGC
jgi:tetratricopeptide (TPR) repeat protein